MLDELAELDFAWETDHQSLTKLLGMFVGTSMSPGTRMPEYLNSMLDKLEIEDGENAGLHTSCLSDHCKPDGKQHCMVHGPLLDWEYGVVGIA